MLSSVAALVVFCAIASPVLAGGGGCRAGGGFGGFGGGSSYPFELPKVEEDVEVGGVTLKLNRTKWGYSVFANSAEGPLARFVGEDIEVTLRRIAPAAATDRALADALAAEAGVLYARRVATSGAIVGVKAAYGSRQNAWTDQTKMRYFLKGRRIELALFRGSSHRQVPAVARRERPRSAPSPIAPEANLEGTTEGIENSEKAQS